MSVPRPHVATALSTVVLLAAVACSDEGGGGLGSMNADAQPDQPDAGGPVQGVSFRCSGELCRGVLYLPPDLAPGAKAPAIVLANALTAVKEITVPGYAQRFAAAGFVALTFDYRGWGESEGEPRNHVVPYEMQQDIRDAITFLSMEPEVDADRIGGWGNSLGGENMMHLAAFDRRLKAVAVTSSGPSSVAIFEQGAGVSALQALLATDGQERAARHVTGEVVTYKQAWCRAPSPDCLAPIPEAYDFYINAQKTVAPGFENRITSQSLINLAEYSPDAAIQIAAPTALLIVHPASGGIAPDLMRQVFDRAGEPKRFVLLEGSQIELYATEPWLTQSANEAIDWFNTYLVGPKTRLTRSSASSTAARELNDDSRK